jgi:pre-rRNA-processing protein TSR1
MSVDAPMEPLSVPTDKADDLTAENTPDPLANEQTWPTEEEMGGSINGASGPSREGVRTKRVPKGTSAYQAAWIFDDEDGEDEDDDDEDDDDEMDDDEAPQLEERFSGDEETEEIELDSRRSELHRDLDPEQEEEE